MKCAFLGLSHLGLVYSTASAARGWEVVQFSPQVERIRLLSSGGPDIYEPGLMELWEATTSRRTLTADESLLANCDLLMVAPDVQTTTRGESDLTEVDSLVQTACRQAQAETPIVLLSQVPPGYTRSQLHQRDLIYYQVETLVFGQAVERAMSPERFIVGAPESLSPLPDAYLSWLSCFKAPVHLMRFESAELAKISINLFLAATLSTTNSLAELAEKIGADWKEIVPTLQEDRRIGKHAYLSPGLGISGGNIERDLVAFDKLAHASEVNAGVINSFYAHSTYRKQYVVEKLVEVSENQGVTIGLLGIAYKVGTSSVKNSPTVLTIASLPRYEFVVHDPLAVLPVSLSNARQVRTVEFLLKDSDVLAIMTPWPEYIEELKSNRELVIRKRAVIDPFNLLPADFFRGTQCQHVVMGRGDLR